MKITTIGLDLAKSVFQVHAVDASGQVVVRNSLRRSHRVCLCYSFLKSLPYGRPFLRQRRQASRYTKALP